MGSVFAVLVVLLAPLAAYASQELRAGDRAIEFTGTDVSGRAWRPSDASGRAVALFFFCGCDACHRVARAWAGYQRAGVVAQAAKPGSEPPITVAVFAGDSQAARLFAAQTCLTGNVVLIADPGMKATELYQAQRCPRVFVINSRGAVRYTNNSADDAPQGHNEQRIAFKVLQSLRNVCTESDRKQWNSH